jgi:hypothetical protein
VSTIQEQAPTTSTTTPRRGRRRAIVVGALVVVGLVAAALVYLLNGEEQVPYDDARSTGLLTLCGSDGKAVQGGKLGDRPFAQVVLGSTAAPAGYDGDGRVAVLYAHQPRSGVETAEFSGQQLIAPTSYAAPADPAAALTAGSTTLADFVAAFPATNDGYVQLRLVLASPEGGALTDQYDTADLRVDGDSWHLVRGGNASCAGAADAVRTDSTIP